MILHEPDSDFNCTNCNDFIPFRYTSYFNREYFLIHDKILCFECNKHLKDESKYKKLNFVNLKKVVGV